MSIVKLDSSHKELVKDLFTKNSYMGSSNIADFFKNENKQGDHNIQYYYNFVNTYLSDLASYTAFAKIKNEKIVGIIAAYGSSDDPSWYGTQIRSTGSKIVVRELLDTMIDYQESLGRLKFYTLWNSDETRLLRRFAFSERTNERYDYFDEYYVPAKHRCFYTNHWHVLFNRVLLPVDTVVRCTFLKQKYRETLFIGGGL